jgi:hypothetical protein
MTEPAQPKWKVDRTVPLAVIVTMALQTVGAVWWAATLSARVNQLETNQVSSERTGRIEEQVIRLREDLGDIKTDLKALLRKP